MCAYAIFRLDIVIEIYHSPSDVILALMEKLARHPGAAQRSNAGNSGGEVILQLV